MKIESFDIHYWHELDDDLDIIMGFGDITTYLDDKKLEDDRPEKIETIIRFI